MTKCSGSYDTHTCCSDEKCTQTPYGYYCNQTTDLTCGGIFTKCGSDGKSLQKCENGVFVVQSHCDGGCSAESGEPFCNMFAKIDPATNSLLNECKTEYDCCGTGICQRTGWFTRDLVCQVCPGSQECSSIDRKCTEIPVIAGDTPIVHNNQCYANYNPTGKSSAMIRVSQNICDDYNAGDRTAKIDAGEIVTAALSSEDQYALRDAAFKAYQDNPNVSWGDKLAAGAMSTGDKLGAGWGAVGSTFSKLLAGASNSTVGSATAETTSSLGNYYVAAYKTDWSDGGPTVPQAIGTGLLGGGMYAYTMTLGAINGLTMGKIEPLANLNTAVEDLNKQTLTAIYEGKEDKAAFAQSSQKAGNDLTNTIALFVPVGKAVQGVGNGLEKAGTALANKGGAVGAVSGNMVGFTGTVFKTAGKVAQVVSPESWAAPFIKSAPITTALEIGAARTAKAVSGVAVVKTVVTNINKAGVALTVNPITKPVASVVSFAAKASSKAAEGAFQLFVPRSALTFTKAEAANLIARDLKFGLTDAADVLARVNSKYHIKLNSVAEVEQFLKPAKLEPQVAENILTAVKTQHPEVAGNPALLEAQTKLAVAQKEAAALQPKPVTISTRFDDLISLLKNKGTAARKEAERLAQVAKEAEVLKNAKGAGAQKTAPAPAKAAPVVVKKPVAVKPVIQPKAPTYNFIDRLLQIPKQAESRLIKGLWAGADDTVIRKAMQKVDPRMLQEANAIARIKAGLQKNIGEGNIQTQAIRTHDGGKIQDAFVVNKETGTVTVADGVSTAKGSDLVAKKVVDQFTPWVGSRGKNITSLTELLTQTKVKLAEIQKSIMSNKASKEGAAVFCTGYFNNEGKFISIRMGDAEVRIMRDNTIYHIDDLINKDGSHLFKGKFLEPDNAVGSKIQGVRENTPSAMGQGSSYWEPRITEHSVYKNDKIMMSSDGLHKVLSENEIATILKNSKTPQEAEQTLVATALNKNRGVPVDDYGVVVIFR